MDNTQSTLPADTRINQNQGDSSPENGPVTLPDELLRKTSTDLRNTFDLIRAQDLLAQERLRQAKRRKQKDRRIRDCVDNQLRNGRGKFTFIISPETFSRILQFVEKSEAYKVGAVIDALKQIYVDGIPFHLTGVNIASKTLLRHLKQAFTALEIDLPVNKSPSLSTLLASHHLIRDARIVGFKLEDSFTIV